VRWKRPEVFHEVDDLRLDGDVKGGDRLSATMKLGFEDRRARCRCAVAAPPEIVRVAVMKLGLRPQTRITSCTQLFGGCDPGDAEVSQRLGDDVPYHHARVQ